MNTSNLYKYLPQRLRLPEGTFVNALARSVDSSDQRIMDLIQACIDQLFLTTANGRFLVQLGEQEGFVMPANSGLDIRAYRVLVPLMVAAPKQIRKTIDEIIEAFYSQDRTRPSITASVPSPYNLMDGDDIQILTDKGRVVISVQADQVSDIANIDASELAALINAVQGTVYADTIADRSTALRYLRLTSVTAGSGAHIRVVGGTMQNVLHFPTMLDTDQRAGTTWTVTKEQPYTDVTRFQWNGSGFNPKMYNVRKGDIATMRGLSVAELNGSFEIIDAGYDYFVVRNTAFRETLATIVQATVNDIVFTSQLRVTLYNNSEYGLTSETKPNVATVTIPAIPPLTRRFLSGSGHLHGAELLVKELTRNSVKLLLPLGGEMPASDNEFVLRNNEMMYDFRRSHYKTTGTDGASVPTFYVASGLTNYAVLPHTAPTYLGSNPWHGEAGSSEITLNFPYAHGLYRGWQFTISNCTGIANIPADLLNTDHLVATADFPNRIVVTLKDTNGNPIVFKGLSFGPFNLRRHSIRRDDGADFYLEFPDEASAVASGLQVGMTFRLEPNAGVDVEAFYADAAKHQKLFVCSLDGSIVHVRTGLGVGEPSLIISDGYGNRSCDFGGDSGTYFFDQTSSWNQTHVMDGLRVCMFNYVQSKNPAYRGSFIFDPTGADTLHTVSRFITTAASPILRGSNDGVIFVERVERVFGTEDFPTTGKLLIDYGTDNVEGPINYIATISSTTGASQILLDPSYRFKKSHNVGALVQFVHASVPYTPGLDGKDYPVYITGTAQSRNTLFQLLSEMVAAGVFVEPDVLLPSLRFSDVSIPPFE